MFKPGTYQLLHGRRKYEPGSNIQLIHGVRLCARCLKSPAELCIIKSGWWWRSLFTIKGASELICEDCATPQELSFEATHGIDP